MTGGIHLPKLGLSEAKEAVTSNITRIRDQLKGIPEKIEANQAGRSFLQALPTVKESVEKKINEVRTKIKDELKEAKPGSSVKATRPPEQMRQPAKTENKPQSPQSTTATTPKEAKPLPPVPPSTSRVGTPQTENRAPASEQRAFDRGRTQTKPLPPTPQTKTSPTNPVQTQSASTPIQQARSRETRARGPLPIPVPKAPPPGAGATPQQAAVSSAAVTRRAPPPVPPVSGRPTLMQTAAPKTQTPSMPKPFNSMNTTNQVANAVLTAPPPPKSGLEILANGPKPLILEPGKTVITESEAQKLIKDTANTITRIEQLPDEINKTKAQLQAAGDLVAGGAKIAENREEIGIKYSNLNSELFKKRNELSKLKDQLESSTSANPKTNLELAKALDSLKQLEDKKKAFQREQAIQEFLEEDKRLENYLTKMTDFYPALQKFYENKLNVKNLKNRKEVEEKLAILKQFNKDLTPMAKLQSSFAEALSKMPQSNKETHLAREFLNSGVPYRVALADASVSSGKMAEVMAGITKDINEGWNELSKLLPDKQVKDQLIGELTNGSLTPAKLVQKATKYHVQFGPILSETPSDATFRKVLEAAQKHAGDIADHSNIAKSFQEYQDVKEIKGKLSTDKLDNAAAYLLKLCDNGIPPSLIKEKRDKFSSDEKYKEVTDFYVKQMEVAFRRKDASVLMKNLAPLAMLYKENSKDGNLKTLMVQSRDMVLRDLKSQIEKDQRKTKSTERSPVLSAKFAQVLLNCQGVATSDPLPADLDKFFKPK